MEKDLIKLKNKLKIALYYDFYFECLVIEYKVLNILLNNILYIMKKENSEKLKDSIRGIKELNITDNLILNYIVENLLKEISTWEESFKKGDIDIFESEYQKLAVQGKNLISSLENNIILLKKQYDM